MSNTWSHIDIDVVSSIELPLQVLLAAHFRFAFARSITIEVHFDALAGLQLPCSSHILSFWLHLAIVSRC